MRVWECQTNGLVGSEKETRAPQVRLGGGKQRKAHVHLSQNKRVRADGREHLTAAPPPQVRAN